VTLVVSAVEHISVLMTASYVDPGFRVVPVRGDGRIDLDALDSVLAGIGPSALLSLQWANNETGVVQPVAEAVAIAHRHGALIHVDAVQAAGKIEIDFAASAIDLLSLSAHKIGGPQGVGALVVRRGLAVLPMIAGGRQEGGHRAGTENVAGIVGFGVAATLSGQDAGSQRVSVWRDMIERQLESVAAIQVFAESSPRLGNTTCFATPGLAGETQVIALDLDGVSVSSGAACSSGKVEPSHVLRAMGVPDHVARSAIRVSLGWNSSEADAARFIDAWLRLWRRVHSVAAARAA
jgi:cysteine desulfurase